MSAGAPIIVSRRGLNLTQSVQADPVGQGVAQAMRMGETQRANARGDEAEFAAMRMSGTAQAMFQDDGASRFYRQVGQIAAKAADDWNQSIKTVRLANGQSEYLTGLTALEEKYTRDTDYLTAPQRFEEEHAKLKSDVLERIGDGETQLNFENRMLRVGLSAASGVRQAAHKRTGEAYGAAVDGQELQYLSRAAQARSPAERAAAEGDFARSIDEGVRSGWFTADGGEKRKQAFSARVDDAAITRGIRENPAATLAALKDPEQFRFVDPVTRETRASQAAAAVNEQQGAVIQQRARFDPAGAALQLGVITDPRQIEQIIDKALIPQESSGNPNAVSNKGAAGLTQFMPDTARMVAKQMGLTLFNGMEGNDEAVREALKANPQIARAMAVKHLGDLAKRYDGNVSAAFAAYHAGAGRADKFHAEATAKFGAGYTAAELASVIPASLTDGDKTTPGKATRDYVLDMYRRLGADPGGSGMTSTRRLQLGSTVAAESQQQQAAELRSIKEIVTLQGDERDAVLEGLKKGYAVNPAQIEAVRAPLMAAAKRGDTDAQVKLTRLDTLERIAPIAREAWNQPPEVVEGVVAQLETRAARGEVSAAERQRLTVFREVASEMATARKERPRDMAARQGYFQAETIRTPQGGADAAFVQSFAAAALQAEQAQRIYGGDLVITRPQERAAIKAAWGEMSLDSRTNFLAGVARAPNVGEATRNAFLAEIGADGVAQTAAHVSARPGGTDLAREMLRGQKLLEQPGVQPKAADVRDALRRTLSGATYGDATGQVIEAALSLYAAERDGAGKLFDASDSRAIKAAIEKITGPIVSVNGRPTPIAPQLGETKFLEGWRRLSTDDLKAAGGAVDAAGRPFDPSFLRDRAQLLPAAPGSTLYALAVPQGDGLRPVLNAQGRPLVIDVARLSDAVPAKRAAELEDLRRRDPAEFDQRTQNATRRRDALRRTGFDPEAPR